MQAFITNALALEMRETPSKDGNQVYNDLVVYEFGQKYRPLLKLVSVAVEQVSAARALVGRRCSINVDLRDYQSGTRYIFVDGKVDAVKAAA